MRASALANGKDFTHIPDHGDKSDTTDRSLNNINKDDAYHTT